MEEQQQWTHRGGGSENEVKSRAHENHSHHKHSHHEQNKNGHHPMVDQDEQKILLLSSDEPYSITKDDDDPIIYDDLSMS